MRHVIREALVLLALIAAAAAPCGTADAVNSPPPRPGITLSRRPRPPFKLRLPPPRYKHTRSKNGIRLVGGSGPRGRLEVATTSYPWSNGVERVYRPVCDLESFDDDMAGIMCSLLGYKYGRKYYSTATNHLPMPGTPVPDAQQPVSRLACYPTAEGGDGTGRRLLLEQGNVDIPGSAPYVCGFRQGGCGPAGPVVALECSDTAFGPAPPPPPQPPSPSPPPPRPPNTSPFVKIFDIPEPNLCDAADYACFTQQRVEVYAPAASGNSTRSVWAPLCAVDDALWGDQLYNIICFQYQDWPWRFAGDSSVHQVSAFPGNAPFPIPSGPVVPGVDFDPSAYPLWAYVVGDGTTAGRSTIQELGLVLRPKPCPSGMLAMTCQALQE